MPSPRPRSPLLDTLSGARGLFVALVLSLGVHVGTLALVRQYVEAPSFDFEFEVPDGLELGFTEEIEVGALDSEAAALADLASAEPADALEPEVSDPPETEPAEAERADEPPDERGDEALDAGVADAGLDAGPARASDAGFDGAVDAGDAGLEGGVDAGAEDAAVDAGADAAVDAGADAGYDGDPDEDAGLSLASGGEAEVSDARDGRGGGTGAQAGERIPRGAQLALRIDFATVRGSPLAPQVRRLVERIPYWQRLLDGSGIDVVEDLDLLMIASPDPRSIEGVVVAGRLRAEFEGPPSMAGGVAVAGLEETEESATAPAESAPMGPGMDPAIVRTVERLASLRTDEPVEWQRMGRIPYAPWMNVDRTPRVLAIVGRHRFTISRQRDLRRVLGLAQVRGRRRGGDEGPDALLALPEGVVYSLEVDGLRNYVRGAGAVRFPEAAIAELSEAPENGVRLFARGDMESADQAEEAVVYWREQVRRARGNLMVQLAGGAALLALLEFESDDDQLQVRADLSQAQAQALLNLLIRLFPASDATQITSDL